MKSGGIYEIVNTADGRRYIGSAVCFAKRWASHRHDLRTGAHANKKLQRAWDKHGETAFDFIPMLACGGEDLLIYEQLAIDGLRPEYNIRRTAGSSLGMATSAETREKLSVATRRHLAKHPRVFSDETRARLSAAKVGKTRKPHSKETREKIRSARLGSRVSAETKRKLSLLQSGKKLSLRHRANISAGMVVAHARRKQQ